MTIIDAAYNSYFQHVDLSSLMSTEKSLMMFRSSDDLKFICVDNSIPKYKKINYFDFADGEYKVKEEIIKNNITKALSFKYPFKVRVIPDRLQVLDMWYEQGLFTFNVNQGNLMY